MTKKEREAIQGHINRLQELQDKAHRAFERLQELNASEGTGYRWCSAKQNAMDLLKSGKDYMYLYEAYIEAGAAQDAINRLGADLANLGFWG